MAKTISELRNQSIQVRDASAAGENTATRVGTVLNDIVGHIEDYENTQSSNNSSQDAKIEGVKSSLNAEIARAKTEESNLSTQIGTERTERQAAVSREETARIQADNDEKTARQQADNAEQDARIKADNDEKTARENADITLRTMIQTEVSNRQIAVKQEEIRAMAAEEANAQAITDENARATTAEAAETARAKAEEERLQGEIDNTNTNVETLDNKVNSNHDHLTVEVARLDLTDNEIKADLEAEKARAKAAEQANVQAIADENARAKAAEQANAQAIADETARAKAAEQAIIFDVSAHNNGAVFESLQALLSSSDLSTLIPESVRHGGMTIRLIQGSEQTSDNKYAQYFLTKDEWSASETDWQKMNLEEKVSQLGQEVDGINGFRFQAASVPNWGYANSDAILIKNGNFIVNDGIRVMLYVTKDVDGDGTLFLPSGSIIKADRDYHWIRAYDATGNVDLNILGLSANIEDDVYYEYRKITYNEVLLGRIYNKAPQWISGFHRTRPLPIIDGCGYYVSGATGAVIDFYTSNEISADTYISSGSFMTEIPSSAKYMVISFVDSDVADYANLNIVPLTEIVKEFPNAPFSFKKTNVLFQTVENYRSLLQGIRWMRFYGISVNPTKTYQIQFIKSTATLRVVIYDGATTVYDNTFTQSDRVPVSVTNDNDNGYILSLIADFGVITDRDTNDMFILNANAYNSVLPEIQGADINEYCLDGEKEFLDYSEYFEASKGGITGYVLSSTGVYGSDSNRRVTDYIPTANILFIKAYTPLGSGAGLAFYDSEKNALTNYQGTGKAGYSSNENGVSYYGEWKEVPKEAAYFRTSCDYSTNHELYVIKQVLSSENSVLNVLSDRPVPRSTKVIWGYKEFGMVSSRKTINQTTFNEDARQIQAKYEHYFNRTIFEVSFTPSDSNVNIGIGCEYALMSEVRVSGNTFSIRCGSSASDTYIHIDPIVIFSYTLPFSIESGKTYKLGYIKRDASLVNDEYQDNATFYIDDFNGHRYEKTIERTASASEYNGIAGRYSTMLIGRCFVSVKQGNVVVNNVSLSSDYNPRAKCLLTGDSFVAGDTMTAQGQRYKYAALLQQAIGMDDFVIVGKGGEEICENWMIYISEAIRSYCPEYVVIALSCNNHVLSVYEDLLGNMITWLISIGIKPILVTITPYKYGDNTDYRGTFRVAVNNWVRNSGYRYVDICNAVTIPDGTAWQDGLVLSDGVHPSKEGHQVIYETFVKELPELFME